MEKLMTRNYDMRMRSKQAAQTKDNIIAATERLLTNQLLDDVNLKAIAREAGTTVQTVLRHMESRDGCLQAVVTVVAARVEQQRGHSEYKDIDSTISDLLEHYEQDGKLVLNLLVQEQKGHSFASALTRQGRSYHRNWVERCFTSYLPQQNDIIIDALVAATDIYIWKLLRLDLGRSRKAVNEVITQMVKKILEVS